MARLKDRLLCEELVLLRANLVAELEQVLAGVSQEHRPLIARQLREAATRETLKGSEDVAEWLHCVAARLIPQ
jgi:hypothetical protein